MKVYRDPLLKMVHNPGGDSYWEGGQPKLCSTSMIMGGRVLNL